MIDIWIGFDQRETVAWNVLAHSILARATTPVAIHRLDRRQLSGVLWRERDPLDSTDFARSRFLVPHLSGYRGWSLFLDCDMLCLGDVAELAWLMTLRTRWTQAVQVVRHDYVPRQARKFLDQKQTKYARKNWSSVVLFNNEACRALSPEYVNDAPGLDLHQFRWCRDDQIGSLPKRWNYLVGEDNQCDPQTAQLVHWTNGGPYFPQYADAEFAEDWRAERDAMLYAEQHRAVPALAA